MMLNILFVLWRMVKYLEPVPLRGKVLKCFGVRENLQGEGIAAKLITHVTNILFDRGIYETFIFTKPKNVEIFKGLGYREVHSAGDVVLLEGGRANVKAYVEKMFKNSGLGEGKRAALVMNCNPFTLGHRYVIEKKLHWKTGK